MIRGEYRRMNWNDARMFILPAPCSNIVATLGSLVAPSTNACFTTAGFHKRLSSIPLKTQCKKEKVGTANFKILTEQLLHSIQLEMTWF